MGLTGIRFTCTPLPRRRAASSARCFGRVVFASDQRVLEGHAAPGRPEVALRRRNQVPNRVGTRGRHQPLAQLVVRSMQRDRQPNLQALAGQPVDSVDQSHGRDGDVPLAQAERARMRQQPHGAHRLRVVREWLAHAHEDHVRHVLPARLATAARCARPAPRSLRRLRLRSNPIWPVAQNTQPIAHPACVETHTVERGWPPSPGYCISTVSIERPVGQPQQQLRRLTVVACHATNFGRAADLPPASFQLRRAPPAGSWRRSSTVAGELVVERAEELVGAESRLAGSLSPARPSLPATGGRGHSSEPHRRVETTALAVQKSSPRSRREPGRCTSSSTSRPSANAIAGLRSITTNRSRSERSRVAPTLARRPVAHPVNNERSRPRVVGSDGTLGLDGASSRREGGRPACGSASTYVTSDSSWGVGDS